MYPCSSSEFGRTDYKSCYLSWHTDESENMGLYVEPPSYCQDDSFYQFGFHNYRDGEDDVIEHADPSIQVLMPPGEDDVIEHADPSIQVLMPPHNASGSANLLGDYFSHFAWDGYKCSEGYDAFNDGFSGSERVKDSSDFVGWDEYKFSEGCDGLDMVKDPYKDKELYNSYGSSDKERETQFRVDHIPWFDCDFGFQYKVDEDNGAADLKQKYSQTWESWDEMGLYEQIFGNWHNMLRSGTESRVETGLA